MPDDLIQEEIRLLERKKELLQGVQQKNAGRFGSILTGIGQGLTFGFADEIGSGIQALARAPFSPKTFGELYNESLDERRKFLESAQEEHPVLTGVGTVAGGIAQGGGVASAAKGVLTQIPRLVRVAGLGAAEGAAFGAGTATEDRLAGAAKGAALGAIAAPVASGVGTAVGRTISKVGAPIARAVANTPRRQASRIVSRAMELDELGPASVGSELSRLGPQSTLADLGENLSGLARGATAKPGRARSIASNLLRDRQNTQQRRLLEAAGVDFDVGDFKRAFRDVMTLRQSSAAPKYEEAYASSLEITPRLQALLNRPTVKSALARANRIVQDEGGGTGHVRVMDAVKQDIDDRIGAALRQGKRNTARRLLNIKRDLLAEVDAQVPAYKEAREIFSSEASLRDSANLGRSILTSKVNLDDAELAIESMTAGERHAFQLGSIRGLIDKLEATPENRNVAGKLIESVRARDLLRVAFPDDETFNRFLQTARAESVFSFTKNRVLGGSPTARIQEEVTDLSKEAGLMSALRGGDPLSLGVQFLRNIGMGDVSDETLEEVSRLLFSQRINPQQVSALTGTRVIPKISETVRQGATAGGVNALLTQ